MLQGAFRFEVPSPLAIFLSLAVVLTECFLAVALWFSVARRAAMLVGFLLHSSFLALLVLGPLLVGFELEILALYILFLDIAPGEYLVGYDRRHFLTTRAPAILTETCVNPLAPP